jgi:hypothetical protein
MTVQLRLTRNLLSRTHADLSRRHPFAAERVAFISCKPATIIAGTTLVAEDLHPVRDDDYEEDETAGAMLGSGAFRSILQYALNNAVSVLHVHRHEHPGKPWFSSFDLSEARKYIPDFWKVRPSFPHGIFVLSHDSAAGLIWLPGAGQVRLSRITVVGAPSQEIYT